MSPTTTEFAHVHAPRLVTRVRLSNAFSGVEQRSAAETLRCWVMAGRPRERLVEAFFASPTSDVEAELSAAVRVLEALVALPNPK